MYGLMDVPCWSQIEQYRLFIPFVTMGRVNICLTKHDMKLTTSKDLGIERRESPQHRALVVVDDEEGGTFPKCSSRAKRNDAPKFLKLNGHLQKKLNLL